MKVVTLVGKGPAGGAKGGFVGFVGGGRKERQRGMKVRARARAQDNIIKPEWVIDTVCTVLCRYSQVVYNCPLSGARCAGSNKVKVYLAKIAKCASSSVTCLGDKRQGCQLPRLKR